MKNTFKMRQEKKCVATRIYTRDINWKLISRPRTISFLVVVDNYLENERKKILSLNRAPILYAATQTTYIGGDERNRRNSPQ